jgi:hypothetical protein
MEKSIKKAVKWTNKIIKCRITGPEPPLNREGYWKEKEQDEIKVNRE